MFYLIAYLLVDDAPFVYSYSCISIFYAKLTLQTHLSKGGVGETADISAWIFYMTTRGSERVN